MKTQKTWFITGASRGFGLEITKAVLASGDKVVGTVRSKGPELSAQLNNDPNLLVVTMDVTNEQQVKAAVQQAVDQFGQINILINNAGYGLLSGVEEATNEEVKQNYEVNVFGALNVIRAVLPFMREKRAGHIINISSVGGLGAYMGWGLYGSTKFAIEGITEALAMEVAPLGIKATVVAPGFFRTNFLDESSLISSKQIISDYAETVGAMREFAAKANNKQPGDPEKLAQAFIALGNSENPPVHLPLGKDTLDRFRAKTTAFEMEITDWLDTITGTDHDDVEAKFQEAE
ncbi:oxidoreductase [Dyadobacter sp. NIV53]|uniref:oxidoreductase n=1 Tax=Dyadobacter sp. NIV53 TaxID=2861765 RepID=UPI001C86ACA7|nr:oxidoreductase [Dyadobacter sp. NIV53]